MSFEQKQTSGTARHEDKAVGDFEASSIYAAALTAYDSGDYAESLRLFKTAADKGDAAAAWNLYVMYLNGDGVEKDETESFRWLLRSAELDDADAMFSLAVCCYQGIPGKESDYKRSLFWAKKAKESGRLNDEDNAKIDELIEVNEAAIAFDAGLAAEDAGNYTEAVRQFMTAADKGEATAAWNLYIMYLNGNGVEKDETKIVQWLLRSAELGSIDAMFMAATWYCNGSDYLEEDDEQALFWAKKAKESDELDDDYDAQIDDLIRQIESDIAFNAATAAQDAGNYAEAVRQYEIASDKGDAYAMYSLAEGYYKGTFGTEKDYKQALFWAQKAKDSRDLDDGSAAKVDDMIRSIERHMAFSAGFDAKNAGHLSEAIRQYKKAVDLGSASAAWNLFVLFYNGEGVKKNETESFRWLLRSAELGDAYGMRSLAVCCYWGTLGTKKDKERALYWAVKAKESGRLNDDDTAQMEDIIRRIREEV